MANIIRFLRLLALGMVAGEALLVLGLLDGARAGIMARATGMDWLNGTAPLAQIVVRFASYPVWKAAEMLFGQDPIALFALLISYWALLGAVLVFPATILLRRMIWRTKSPRLGDRGNLPGT